jgi:hypothetical protein
VDGDEGGGDGAEAEEDGFPAFAAAGDEEEGFVVQDGLEVVGVSGEAVGGCDEEDLGDVGSGGEEGDGALEDGEAGKVGEEFVGGAEAFAGASGGEEGGEGGWGLHGRDYGDLGGRWNCASAPKTPKNLPVKWLNDPRKNMLWAHKKPEKTPLYRKRVARRKWGDEGLRGAVYRITM